MEAELSALRDAFKEAELNQDTNRMLTISKVIIQYEKSIASQKVQEGKTLDRETVMRTVDELAENLVGIARAYVPPDRFDSFCDVVMATLAGYWSR